jgi:hypothetical protein
VTPVVFMTALLLTCGAPALKEPPKKESPLAGKWIEESGVDPLEYEFTAGGEWIISRSGAAIDNTARTYKLVPKDGANAIDLTENPNPYPSLFRIRDDVLTVCIRFEGGGRPSDVDERDRGLLNLRFVRVKPDK